MVWVSLSAALHWARGLRRLPASFPRHGESRDKNRKDLLYGSYLLKVGITFICYNKVVQESFAIDSGECNGTQNFVAKFYLLLIIICLSNINAFHCDPQNRAPETQFFLALQLIFMRQQVLFCHFLTFYREKLLDDAQLCCTCIKKPHYLPFKVLAFTIIITCIPTVRPILAPLE